MNLLRRFYEFFIRENLHRLFLLIAGLIVFSTVGLVIFEDNVSWPNAVWWSMVTLTTVGYGDIAPATIGGRVVGAITMLFGIGVLGMFTASIASVFVEKKLRINRGMSSFEFNNHIVICEWNYRAREILSSLRADPRTREKTVLLIADLPEKPVEDENLYFIQGDITEENMKRANLKGADTAVVLGDDSLDPNARDAQVVLAALAIENLNSEVYTIVELVNERNVRHCQRARVDEIIVGSEFSSKLIARAAMDQGISVVLTELVSSEQGNDLHKRALPEAFDGKTFFEVFVDMKKQHNRTVVAVQRGGDRRVVSNPPGDMVLKKGDFLIQIAPKEDSVSEKRVAKSE